MMVYVARRLLAAVPVLLGVSLLAFSMLHFLPGDPVLLMMAESGGSGAKGVTAQDTYESVRHELGLDRPLPVQFGIFLWRALHGDLGRSFRGNQRVATLIGEAFPYTVRLTLVGLGLAIPIGIALGTLAAVRPGSYLDNGTMVAALFAVSMPSFWFGIMLLLVFALHLDIFPAVGYGGVQAIVLPALTLGLGSAAIIAALVRSSLREVLGMEFVATARAKGLPARAVVLKHALRNALIPVATVVGLQFGALLGGAVVVETVFARPGLGLMLVNGIKDKDFPVVQAGILVAAAAYVLANLLVDLSYGWLDPRIRLDGKAT